MAQGLYIPGVGNVFSETVVFTSVDYWNVYRYSANGSYADLHDRASSVGLTQRVGAGQEVGRWTSISGGIRWTSLGTISSLVYSKITTTTSGKGSVSGAGNYLQGDTVTITATPSTGYVVTKIGDTVFTPSTGAKSISFAASVDRKVAVVFQPYYRIVFNANGGEGSIGRIYPCVANVSYTLPVSGFTKDGYALSGFSTTATGNVEYPLGGSYSLSSVTAGSNKTLYAVWGQPTLTYDSNGGTTTPASVSYYGNITLAGAVSKTGRTFVGWKIGNVVYAAKATYNLSANVTAVAQWNTISFKNSNPEAGKISLYDLTANKKVADENSNGYLIYNGTVGSRYRVDCALSGVLYTKRGVYVDGKYEEPYTFVFDGTDVTGEYFYKDTPLYSVGIECTSGGNTASVTTPASADKDGKYVEGRAITITATPAAGYDLSAANVINTDTGLVIGSYSDISGNIITIDSLRYNIKVSLIFTKLVYKVSALIDSNSAAAISSVTVTRNGTVVSTAEYGDTVVFTANTVSGYEFHAWYWQKDASRVSTSRSYSCTITGNLTLVAKARVRILTSIRYEDTRDVPTGTLDESCSFTIDGTENKSSHAVILGSSFTYSITLGAISSGSSQKWIFKAWEKNGVPTQMPMSGTITPTESMNLTAVVCSAAIEHTVSIKFYNETVDNPLSVTKSAVTTTGYASIKVSSNTVTLVYNQTCEVLMNFAEQISGLSFIKATLGDYLYDTPTNKIVINDDAKILVFYSDTGPRTITITYAEGCDRSMGEIVLDDESSADNTLPIAITKNRGQSINLGALTINGYKFAGWYLLQEGIGTPYISQGEYNLLIDTNLNLFAKFVTDPNAIYKWEGSSENKMMTWRSKTYEASKPFNPSACRVDTRGYPVWELSVEMFSAPDASPTAIATLNNVASQDSRRLPIRRMERYMQIAIENNNEVDAVLVGTSMGGLAV